MLVPLESDISTIPSTSPIPRVACTSKSTTNWFPVTL